MNNQSTDTTDAKPSKVKRVMFYNTYPYGCFPIAFVWSRGEWTNRLRIEVGFLFWIVRVRL